TPRFPCTTLFRSRRVFLLRVMPLEDLTEISVVQGCAGAAGGLKQYVDSDKKIRGIKKAGTATFNVLSYFVQFFVPAGGADHDICSRANARENVIEYCFWRGEVEDDVDLAQALGG